MSDKRDQASEELLPDELVNDAGELDDVSTEWNEAEFHDETNDADHLVEDQDLGEAVYNEEMLDEEDLKDSSLNRSSLDAQSDDNDLER
jgi:hypothetical protein